MIKKITQNQRQTQFKSNKKQTTNIHDSNSGFSKKLNQPVDSIQIKNSHQEKKLDDIQDKKKAKSNRKKNQKLQKQSKQKNLQNQKQSQVENFTNKSIQEAYDNITNNQSYGQDSAKELSNFILKNIQRRDGKIEESKGADETRNKKNQELVSSCSVEKLKRIRGQKIEDSDFFQKSQDHNNSKRLLILQYNNQQVYIHQNNQKNTDNSNFHNKKVPQIIKNVFQTKQSPFFNNFSTVRIPTQQTYDTSNPSTVEMKLTPSSRTPRSNQSFQISRDRTNSYQKQMNLNYMQIYQHQENEIYKYDYEQYYQYMNDQEGKISNRRRRIISFEQSKAFIIDTGKIEIDGRTTIMIRNIPNKYTHDMLLELINRNNKKKFDFFYLPIDYTNSCNMGYAFVNFIHTKFIKDFYKQFNGQKWEKFNSEKICSLSYARIQGTFSLISHFQNAGVMYQKQRKIRPLIDVNEQFMNNLSTIIQKQKQNN